MVFFFSTRHISSSFSAVSSPVLCVRGPFNSFVHGSFSTRISILSIPRRVETAKMENEKYIRTFSTKEGHLSDAMMTTTAMMPSTTEILLLYVYYMHEYVHRSTRHVLATSHALRDPRFLYVCACVNVYLMLYL